MHGEYVPPTALGTVAHTQQTLDSGNRAQYSCLKTWGHTEDSQRQSPCPQELHIPLGKKETNTVSHSAGGNEGDIEPHCDPARPQLPNTCRTEQMSQTGKEDTKEKGVMNRLELV